MNLKVVDSYLISDLKDIENEVNKYYDEGSLDHCRTKKSYIKEWFAHNWLYAHGLFLSHTKDVDLNGDESLHRLIGYEIIYRLFK